MKPRNILTIFDEIFSIVFAILFIVYSVLTWPVFAGNSLKIEIVNVKFPQNHFNLFRRFGLIRHCSRVSTTLFYFNCH